MLSTEKFWTMYARVYDTLLELRPYQKLLAEVADGLGSKPLRVLDAGCGSGNLSRLLLDRGHDVTSIDSAPGMLALAQRKCPDAKLQMADLDRPLPFPDGHFEAVVCSNVLYSLPRPQVTLSELRRVVRRDGPIVLATPRRGASIGQILREHWDECSLQRRLRLLALTPQLAMLTMFNILILSRQTTEFYLPEQEEFRDFLGGEADVRSTYAGQGWLARLRC